MVTITLKEMASRGITAVDEQLEYGPVQVIENGEPVYVIMDRGFYQELIDAYDEVTAARVKAAMADIDAGLVRKVSPEQLIDEFDLE